MGVTQLWQILSPVECHQPLSSLQGLTLAVDLSIWVCETQAVKQMQGIVSKPFLRNLFFRISHLTQNGVKLVFVIEGTAPELKWDTMMKRQQSRFPVRQAKQAAPRPQVGKQTRKNFNACLKECCELLDILGIPYIQSRGEAEALCALLNAAGLVDGCLTNDGDAFLYGARVVYRNFTMNTKDPHVETYRMSDIEDQLGLDRVTLIGLGLLLGCDFVPKGVPGIGMANAVKLLQTLKGRDVLSRFKAWRSMPESECIDQVELLARRKALGVPDFPQIKVIQEFQVMKDRCPTSVSPWKRPVPAKLQDFAYIKLEWPVEYTLEKVLPLVTLWDMLDLLHSRNPSSHQHLKPHSIVKSRVRQGVPCYEVQWIKPVTESAHTEEFYVTVETQELFSKCHPDVVAAFQEELAQKNVKKAIKGKKKKTGSKKVTDKTIPSVDDLSFNFEKMNMDEVNHNLVESAKDLRPAYNEPSTGWQLVTKAKHSKHLSKHIPAISNTEREEESSTVTSAVNRADHHICVNSVSKGAVPSNQTRANIACEIASPILHTDCGGGMKNQDSTPVGDDTYTPLSERAKRRLRKKQRDKEKALLESHKKVNPGGGIDIDNITENELEILARKTIDHLFDGKTNSNLLTHTRDNGHYFSDRPGNTNSRHDDLKQFRMSSDTSNLYCNGSSLHTIGQLSGRGHGTSSPALNSSCTPRTFMKQSGSSAVNGDMFHSPILNGNQSEAGGDPLANFRFIDTPDISKKVYGSREAFDKKVTKYPLKNSENSKPFLNGQRDESYCRNDGANGARKGNTFSKLPDEKTFPRSGSEVLTPKFQTPSMHANTPTAKSLKTEKVNETTKSPGILDSDLLGNFSLQSSLMNSLCASLVQAMTPKGVNVEEYESLRATLQEFQTQQKQDISVGENNFDFTEEDCEIVDLSEIEKASSTIKNPFGNGVELKPISLCGQKKAQEATGSVQMTKTAKKKLRKAQKLMRENLANDNGGKSSNLMKEKRQLFGGKKENGVTQMSNQRPDYVKKGTEIGQNNSDFSNQGKTCSCNVRMNVLDTMNNSSNVKVNIRKEMAPDVKLKANNKHISVSNNSKVCSQQNSSESNGKMKLKKKRRKKSDKNESCFYETFEDLLKDVSESKEATVMNVVPNVDETDTEGFNKKKKKSRKKKVKKASADMDLSADGSMLTETDSKLSDEFLVKALQATKEKPLAQGRERLSLSINSMTDDTLLELETLSFQLAGTSVSLTGKERLKLAALKVTKSNGTVDQTDEEIDDENNEICGDQLEKYDTNKVRETEENAERNGSTKDVSEENSYIRVLEGDSGNSTFSDDNGQDSRQQHVEKIPTYSVGYSENGDYVETKLNNPTVGSEGRRQEDAKMLQHIEHCNGVKEHYNGIAVPSIDQADNKLTNQIENVHNVRNGSMKFGEDLSFSISKSSNSDNGNVDEKVIDLTENSDNDGTDAEVQQCVSDELTNSQIMTCRNCGRNEWFGNSNVEDRVGTPSVPSNNKGCMTRNESLVKGDDGNESIELFSETDETQAEGTRSPMHCPRDYINASVNGQTNGVRKTQENYYAPSNSNGSNGGNSPHSNGVNAVCTQEKALCQAETMVQSNGACHGDITQHLIGRNGSQARSNETMNAIQGSFGLQVNGAHIEAPPEASANAVNDNSISGNGAFGGIVESHVDFLPTQNSLDSWDSPSHPCSSESSGMQNGDRNCGTDAPCKNREDPSVSNAAAAATPKSLIERLKLKLKKASTRKVLKSFTDKDKKSE